MIVPEGQRRSACHAELFARRSTMGALLHTLLLRVFVGCAFGASAVPAVALCPMTQEPWPLCDPRRLLRGEHFLANSTAMRLHIEEAAWGLEAAKLEGAEAGCDFVDPGTLEMASAWRYCLLGRCLAPVSVVQSLPSGAAHLPFTCHSQAAHVPSRAARMRLTRRLRAVDVPLVCRVGTPLVALRHLPLAARMPLSITSLGSALLEAAIVGLWRLGASCPLQDLGPRPSEHRKCEKAWEPGAPSLLYERSLR